MSVVKFIHRLERINDLIRRGATGNPSQFASRLQISESRLYEILKELRSLGLPIIFSHTCNSYRYEGDAGIEVKIFGRPLREKEMEESIGGMGLSPYHNTKNFINILMPSKIF
ncbi:MAG: hypothetical protein RIG77_01345 [Cyclobacteriaceae bacterium]